MTEPVAEIRELPPRAVLARLLRYALPAGDRETWLRIAASLVFLSLAKIASVCMPLVFGAIVDHLSGGRFDHTVFLWLLGGYVLARLGHELCTEIEQVVFTRVAQRAVSRVALDAFRQLHRLSLDFHLNRRTGDLAKATDRGARGIDHLLSLTMFEILPVGAELLLASGILLVGFGVSYAALILATVTAYVAFTIVCTEWRVRFRIRQNAAEEAAMGCAVDSLLNYETIKHFNAEAETEARYKRLLGDTEAAAVRWRASVSVVNFGQGAIITLGLLLVMLAAGRDIAGGTMSVGRFVAVNTYLLQLYLPLGFLGHVYREVRSSLADIGRLFGIMDGPSAALGQGPLAARDQAPLPPLRAGAGELTFEGVDFSYAGRQVLRGVSFQVRSGKTVAVVGPSGAGKSTLVRLLLGLYRPDAGTIRLDGCDIATVSPESVREVVGVVPQDAVLFNDTLGHNITLGRNVGPQELDAAARLAMLERLVGLLPQGYETQVGERGLKLSGGERQRVAIARACLKSPPLLVLDEATSSLDSETEKDIQQAIRQASSARSTLIIAHRLSTVAYADAILVLDAGRIVESGRHEELLARKGRYAALWQRQLVEEDTGSPPEGGRAE